MERIRIRDPGETTRICNTGFSGIEKAKSKSSPAVALQLLDPREFRQVVLHYRRHLPHLLHVAAALAKESGSESTQVG